MLNTYKECPPLHNRKTKILHGAIMAVMAATIVLASASTARGAPPSPELVSFLERFHGHTCAGSLMGLRLSLAAKEALAAHGKLKAKCFVLACPVDGVQVGAKTTYGNKALEVEDKGRLHLILTDVETSRQVKARLTETAIEMGQRFKESSGKARRFAEGSSERITAQKEVDAVLDWFRTAPDTQIVTLRLLE